MSNDNQNSQCESCGSVVKSHDGVYISSEKGNRLLCSKCYNEHMAEYLELDFQHVTFDPITMQDSDGVSHIFDFRTHLFGQNVSIEAFEIKDGQLSGYQFAIDGDSEGDMLALFGRLFGRLRRALSQKHIEPSDVTRYRITSGNVVRGFITWDENTDGQVPCLVIDGKELSWEEFGRMLMTYEGFQFKVEIFDRFEEK